MRGVSSVIRWQIALHPSGDRPQVSSDDNCPPVFIFGTSEDSEERMSLPTGINALHWYRCATVLCSGIEAVGAIVDGWYLLVGLLLFPTVVIHWYQ